MKYSVLLLLVFFAFASCTNDNTKNETAQENDSETLTETNTETSAYPTKVYQGDTHLHTDLSMDAGAFGNRIGMDEAYKFARGEEVTSTTGIKTKLSRPLDFLAITDHSDGMGLQRKKCMKQIGVVIEKCDQLV